MRKKPTQDASKKKATKRAAAKKEKAARAERNTIKREAKGLMPLKDEAYKAFIRSLPCMCCEIVSEKQATPTEAAHIGEVRGFGQKAPDSTCVPLCRRHHKGGPLAHHDLGKRFFVVWRIDREQTIKRFQKLYAAHVRKSLGDRK